LVAWRLLQTNVVGSDAGAFVQIVVYAVETAGASARCWSRHLLIGFSI